MDWPDPGTVISHSLLREHTGERGDTQHSTINNQYSTLNSQHSTLNTQQSTVNNQYSLLNTHFSTLNTQYSTVNTQWTGAGGRGWAASLVKDTDTLGDIFWNLFQSNLQCQVQVRQLCRTTRHKMFFLQNNDGVFSCIRTEYGLASKQILQSVSWY